jgi:hypothetical protein
LGESFHDSRKTRTATRSTSVLPKKIFRFFTLHGTGRKRPLSAPS